MFFSTYCLFTLVEAMAAAQLDSVTTASHQDMPALRAKVVKLQQRDKSHLAKIATLLTTNQQLVEQLHAIRATQGQIRTDMSLLSRHQWMFSEIYISKTSRITRVNNVMRDLVSQIQDFTIIAEMRDTLSVTDTQTQLNRIIAHWMQATVVEELYPASVNGRTMSTTTPMCRPLFTLKNLLEFLMDKDSFRVKTDIVHLLWKYDSPLSKDAQQFLFLRNGQGFPNAVEAYLAIVGTLVCWNLLKLYPVRYEYMDEISVDFSSEDIYNLAILGDSTDLISGPCPATTALQSPEPMLRTKGADNASSPMDLLRKRSRH